MKAVIDTNIVISATLSPKGNPAKIMEMVSDKEIQVYYSSKILSEYKKVLAYERLKIDPARQIEILDIIREDGIFIEPKVSDIPLPDESDRVFYDAAKESGTILITGNMKHYPSESFIMTPAEFLQYSSTYKKHNR